MARPVPVLVPPTTYWECPNCDFTDVTRERGPHSRYHTCSGLRGLSAPMVIADGPQVKAMKARKKMKVEAKVREDYVGKEHGVQFDESGRPIMSIVTTRDDGNDVVVLAPTAQTRS